MINDMGIQGMWGGDSNKSTFIWQLQFVDFVQYEVVVYIHFHFSLRFQALVTPTILFSFLFFKVVPD